MWVRFGCHEEVAAGRHYGLSNGLAGEPIVTGLVLRYEPGSGRPLSLPCDQSIEGDLSVGGADCFGPVRDHDARDAP